MGDVIHNLPAVTDLARAVPDAEIHWVVEEGFQEIPRLHPAVKQVIPIALRRWRRHPVKGMLHKEPQRFRRALREMPYHLILDSQGLAKSALVARMARGPVVGYDRKSIREPVASLLYKTRYPVSRQLHAIERNRQLTGSALGYVPQGLPDYGLVPPNLVLPWAPTHRFATLLTATSRADKEWAESHWIAIGQQLAEQGIQVVLPWGGAAERARSERLARAIPDAVCPPRMSLTEAAALLAQSEVVVGVDTGLVHLAAAMASPVVAIFCQSDPEKTGVVAATPVINLGQKDRPPEVAQVWAAMMEVMRKC